MSVLFAQCRRGHRRTWPLDSGAMSRNAMTTGVGEDGLRGSELGAQDPWIRGGRSAAGDHAEWTRHSLEGGKPEVADNKSSVKRVRGHLVVDAASRSALNLIRD